MGAVAWVHGFKIAFLFFPTKSNKKSSFIMPILNLLNRLNPNTHVYKSCSDSVSSNFILLSRWIFKIFLSASIPILYVRRKTRLFCISYRHLGQYYVFCGITMETCTFCKLDSAESCVTVSLEASIYHLHDLISVFCCYFIFTV